MSLTRIEAMKKKNVSFAELWLGNPGNMKELGQRAYSNQNLNYCIGGSCSKPNQFVSLAGTSLSLL